MASNLVQLSYKPGIQRDGTIFQGDYCTSGFWVRFQKGKIRKIRGMKGVNVNINLLASELIILPDNQQIANYICATTGIYYCVTDTNFNYADVVSQILPLPENPTVLWQSTTVINNNQINVVFLAANNAVNINQNSVSTIYYSKISFGVLTLINNAIAGISPLINGGMCYSAPYLFLYGSNGLVQYSANNNPFNFIPDNTAASGGQFTISNDKVIWGAAIRGGPNAPAVLFWTLSSVVKISNVGTDIVKFQRDVISKSSSILSTKCVVEYDGFFFWPGIDRFFVYNGLVQEADNNINLDYFFDNIDMNFRQKVFGVKNTRYGEIWWFYPEKIDTPGRNPALPAGTNTHALIYNKRENSWYDTAIYRDCGTYSDDFGFLATYGQSIVNPSMGGNTYLWKHEVNTNEFIPDVLNNPIPSTVTTPVFGWSSFNPVYNAAGGAKGQPIDKWIELRRIEPDFVYGNNPAINVSVNSKQYAQSPIVVSDPFPFDNSTQKVDMRVQGRQLSLNFTSGSYFEMGNLMMLVGIGDGQ